VASRTSARVTRAARIGFIAISGVEGDEALARRIGEGASMGSPLVGHAS
jgi:hypothetical protein